MMSTGLSLSKCAIVVSTMALLATFSPWAFPGADPAHAQGSSCPRSFSRTDLDTSIRFPDQVNLRGLDPDTGDVLLVFGALDQGFQRISKLDGESGKEIALINMPDIPVAGTLFPPLMTPIVNGKIYLPGAPGIWVRNVSNGTHVAFLTDIAVQGLKMIASGGNRIFGYRRPGAGDGGLVILNEGNHQILGSRPLSAASSAVSGIGSSADGTRIVVGLSDRIHIVTNQAPWGVVRTITRQEVNLNGVGAAFHRLVLGEDNRIHVTATDRESTAEGYFDVSYLLEFDLGGNLRNEKPLPRRNATMPHLGMGRGSDGSLLLSDGTVYELALPVLKVEGSVNPPDANPQHNNIVFSPDGNRAFMFERYGGAIVEGFEGDLSFRINGEGPLAAGYSVLVNDENRFEICSSNDAGLHYLILASTSIDRTFGLPGGRRLPLDPSGIIPALTVSGSLDENGAAEAVCVVPPALTGRVIYYTCVTFTGGPDPPTTDDLVRIRGVFPATLRVNAIRNQ